MNEQDLKLIRERIINIENEIGSLKQNVKEIDKKAELALINKNGVEEIAKAFLSLSPSEINSLPKEVREKIINKIGEIEYD